MTTLVCLLFCVQVGAKRRETTTLFEVVSMLPEVTLKTHDQSIVAFYHYLEFAVNTRTLISPSISWTEFKF